MTSFARRFAIATIALFGVVFATAANAAAISPGVLAPIKSATEKGTQTTPVHYRRFHRHRHRWRHGPRFRHRFHRRLRRARLRRRCFNHHRPVFYSYRCHRIRRAYRRY